MSQNSIRTSASGILKMQVEITWRSCPRCYLECLCWKVIDVIFLLGHLLLYNKEKNAALFVARQNGQYNKITAIFNKMNSYIKTEYRTFYMVFLSSQKFLTVVISICRHISTCHTYCLSCKCMTHGYFNISLYEVII